MTDQSPIAGHTAPPGRRMGHAGVVVADSPAGPGDAVLKAIKG